MTLTMLRFLTLLKKSYQVRKKCWLRTVIAQILTPIGFFLLVQTVRLGNHSGEYVSDPTYYPMIPKESLLLQSYGLDVLRFTPETNATINLMEYTQICLKRSRFNVTGAINEETMVKDLIKDQTGQNSLFPKPSLGIVFETIIDDSVPKHFKYKFRTPRTLTKDLYGPDENGQVANYLSGSMIAVQMCIDEAYINWVAISSSEPIKNQPNISIQQMPYPPYTRIDKGTAIGGQIFGEVIKFIFLLMLCVEIGFPANEKFTGVNILMSVNGVSGKMNLFSWFLSAAVFSTCYLAPIVIIMRYFMPPKITPFLTYGNPLIVWMVLFMNLCHMIALGYHLSSYFWKRKLGVMMINSVAKR